MGCLETSHVHKVTFAHTGNPVLLSDWGFWWVWGFFFSSIYILKRVAVGLLSGVCIPAALGEQTSQNPILFALQSRKNTALCTWFLLSLHWTSAFF